MIWGKQTFFLAYSLLHIRKSLNPNFYSILFGVRAKSASVKLFKMKHLDTLFKKSQYINLIINQKSIRGQNETF